jgi:hypothetical protein
MTGRPAGQSNPPRTRQPGLQGPGHAYTRSGLLADSTRREGFGTNRWNKSPNARAGGASAEPYWRSA